MGLSVLHQHHARRAAFIARSICRRRSGSYAKSQRVQYGTASASLIDTIIAEIEEGHTNELLPALRHLRSEFYPTYENRAYYDHLVEQFVKQVKEAPSSEK